jgi:hypothetical protein
VLADRFGFASISLRSGLETLGSASAGVTFRIWRGASSIV